MKKRILPLLIIFALLLSCTAQKEALDISKEEQAAFNSDDGQQVEIKDEETEYEIIIIDPGFFTWLNSIARPEGYYSQSFLENRNAILVTNWNIRATQPTLYNPDLYLMPINYDQNIDYGYEVNYKLYNYFIYFQRKYNQRLGPFIPRI